MSINKSHGIAAAVLDLPKIGKKTPDWPQLNLAVYSFSDATRSIYIHRPALPSPWINYLSNGTLHAFVSQAGGGFAWWKSPLKNRISRYRQYNLPIDSPGFYIYLRESDGTVWSPTWRPVEAPLDAWRAEHQPGLTRFIARRNELEAMVEFFIAPGTDALIWDLTLTNHGSTETKLDVFGYVELCLLDWKQDTDWACYVKHNLQVTYDAEANALIYLYRHFHFNPHLADCPLVYFAATEPTSSFTGDRDAFIGAYRTEKNPIALEKNHCGNSEIFCGDPCAALQCPVTVPANGTKRMQFFLGGEPHAIVEWPSALNATRATLRRLRAIGETDRLKTALTAWWDEHLAVLQTELPDEDIARQINIWSPVQAVHTGRYSRSISQNAAGVRTLGFRDTCQDMLAIAYRRPAWATDIFRYLLSQQYEDGHVPHQCNPVEKSPADPKVHIDNPLWLVMLAHAIISETGDLTLLDEHLPWLSEKDSLNQVGEASVWTHLLRVVDFFEANLGAHKIPLTHKGDWNDSIGKFSKHGKGESLFAAQQYAYVLRLLSDLARIRRDLPAFARLEDLFKKQETAILACAWDGAWWRRGFDDDGKPIGSQNCEFGKIWLNTQSWSVLSGVGAHDQQLRAMDSVAELLDTRHCGIKKLHPSFKSFPEVQDPYSGYSPGCGENGAIFCHANAWAIIAEALLGRADRAWNYYRQLVPHLALQKVGIERYQAEPYAYVSNIIGPENPRFGWANVTQVTGTAAWMDIAATQYLLGIRPELDGLRIAPVLPTEWEGFTAIRLFRSSTLKIKVRRGAKPGLMLDGELVANHFIPAAKLKNRASAFAELIVP
jgi:cellobiose phosphorylase